MVFTNNVTFSNIFRYGQEIRQANKLEKTVQQIPFLRSTILLAFGILIGSLLDINIPLLLTVSTSLFLVLLYINRNYTYRIFTFFGIGIHLLFILIGILIFEIYNTKPVFKDHGIYTATILEKPQEKRNSYKSVLKLLAIKTDSTLLQTNEKVLIYFEEHYRAEQLKPGDNISFSTKPQLIKNSSFAL